MDKFEYSIRIGRFHVDTLNEVGQEGWEYLERIDNPQGGPAIMFFKRRVPAQVSAVEDVVYAEAPLQPKRLAKKKEEIVDAE